MYMMSGLQPQKQRMLHELPAQILLAIARELDSDPRGARGWRSVMAESFGDIYPPDMRTSKRRTFAAQLSPKYGHGPGLAFLKDLSARGVAVSRLVEALEMAGHEKALVQLEPAEIPVIIEQPESKTVVLGQPFTLVCRGKGYPPPKYQWFHKKHGEASYKRIRGESKPELHFPSSLLHNRIFCCRLKNIVGEVFSKAVMLVAVKSSTNGSQEQGLAVFQIDPSDRVCRHGDLAVFECQAHGTDNLLYQWFHGDKEMIGEKQPILYIKSVHDLDVGLYTCRVTSPATGECSLAKPAKLHLAVHPRIDFERPTRMNIRLCSGEPLELEVRSDEKSARYTWYHNGIPQAKASASGCLFRVPSVSSVHSGQYYCLVENQWGMKVRSNAFTVSVIAAPPVRCTSVQDVSCPDRERSPLRTSSDPVEESEQHSHGYRRSFHHRRSSARSSLVCPVQESPLEPAITVEPNSTEAVIGGLVQLTCRATGSPPPHYVWRRNGHEVPDGNKQRLSISPIRMEHGGNYQCIVYNNIGPPVKSREVTVRVIVVHEAPTITVQPRSGEVEHGRAIHLRCLAECKAQGVEIPVFYQWKCGNQVVVGQTNPDLNLMDMHGSAWYWCHVRNSIGYSTASDLAYVKVVPCGELNSGVVPMDAGDSSPAVTSRGEPSSANSSLVNDSYTSQESEHSMCSQVSETHPELRCPATGKLALLIANSNYTDSKMKLSLPENDVTLIADHLRHLNYEVLSFMDVAKADMDRVIQVYRALLFQSYTAQPGAYSVFYFAGHGFEVCNEQLLLGVDGKACAIDKSIRLVEIQKNMAEFEQGMHVFILDCCRRQLPTNTQLEPIDLLSVHNMITQYSCCQSESAHEVEGRERSVFTEQLSKCLQQDADKSIHELLVLVQDALQKSSFATQAVNQNSEIVTRLSEDRSLNDPILQTDQLLHEKIFTSWVQRLNATPKDCQEVLHDRAGQPIAELRLSFISYMTNCYLVYLVDSSQTKTHLTANFLLDECEVGRCSAESANKGQVEWLLSNSVGNVVRNKKKKEVVVRLQAACGLDRSELMDVDPQPASPNRVFRFIVEFECVCKGSVVQGRQCFPVELPKKTLFATDSDLRQIRDDIMSG